VRINESILRHDPEKNARRIFHFWAALVFVSVVIWARHPPTFTLIGVLTPVILAIATVFAVAVANAKSEKLYRIAVAVEIAAAIAIVALH
jgi:Na+-translocating ferredoxin:NAD+ oxidoreductase RnfA subunit